MASLVHSCLDQEGESWRRVGRRREEEPIHEKREGSGGGALQCAV